MNEKLKRAAETLQADLENLGLDRSLFSIGITDTHIVVRLHHRKSKQFLPIVWEGYEVKAEIIGKIKPA